MLLVLFFTKDWVVAAAALTVASGGAALADCSYTTIRLDMAPRYSAILHGVSNGIGQIGGTANIRFFQISSLTIIMPFWVTFVLISWYNILKHI